MPQNWLSMVRDGEDSQGMRNHGSQGLAAMVLLPLSCNLRYSHFPSESVDMYCYYDKTTSLLLLPLSRFLISLSMTCSG